MPRTALKEKTEDKYTEDGYKLLGEKHWSKINEDGFRTHVIGLQPEMLTKEGLKLDLKRKTTNNSEHDGLNVVAIFDRSFIIQKFIQQIDTLFRETDDYENLLQSLFEDITEAYSEHKEQLKLKRLEQLKQLIKANNLSIDDLKQLANA